MKPLSRIGRSLLPLILLVSCAQGATDRSESADASASSPTQSPTQSANAASQSASEATQPSPVAHGIPEGFPIDVGVPPSEGDMSVSGPSREERARAVVVCGKRVWPPQRVIDHLGVTVRGPEYLEVRELVVFETAEESVATVERLRGVIAECDSEPNPHSGVDPVRWRLHDAGTGYPGMSFSMLSKEDLGGTIGQVTRVGRGVLLIAVEGESSPDVVLLVLDELITRIRNIAAAMCEFTAAGCA